MFNEGIRAVIVNTSDTAQELLNPFYRVNFYDDSLNVEAEAILLSDLILPHTHIESTMLSTAFGTYSYGTIKQVVNKLRSGGITVHVTGLYLEEGATYYTPLRTDPDISPGFYGYGESIAYPDHEPISPSEYQYGIIGEIQTSVVEVTSGMYVLYSKVHTFSSQSELTKLGYQVFMSYNDLSYNLYENHSGESIIQAPNGYYLPAGSTSWCIVYPTDLDISLWNNYNNAGYVVRYSYYIPEPMPTPSTG